LKTVLNFFIVLFLFFISCNSTENSNIVYVFKGEVTSVSDFKIRYNLWLRQNGLNDSGDLRKSFLFNELSEKMLYENGIKEGVENIPEVRMKIEAFRKKTIIEFTKKRTRQEIYSIDDEAVRKFYSENKDQFMRDKLYRLYSVRLDSKKDADEILNQLRNGANIRMISARYSTDETLSRNNGEWDLFSEDVMDELWKKDIVSGLPGEIFGPYHDADNYYTIIEIAGFAYKRHLSFNLAYPLIIEHLINTQGSEKWDQYRNIMIKEYGAKINTENLNWE